MGDMVGLGLHLFIGSSASLPSYRPNFLYCDSKILVNLVNKILLQTSVADP